MCFFFFPAKVAFWKKKPVHTNRSWTHHKMFPKLHMVGRSHHLKKIWGTDDQEVRKQIKFPCHLEWGKAHNTDFCENFWYTLELACREKKHSQPLKLAHDTGSWAYFMGQSLGTNKRKGIANQVSEYLWSYWLCKMRLGRK